MRLGKNIEEFIKNASIHSNPDVNQALLKDLLQQIDNAETQKSPVTLPNIRRTIMRNPLTKLAVAAVLLVACLIGMSVSYRTSGVAWAIEQSIEAMSQYNAIVVEGLDSERTWREAGSLEQRPFKAWAVANEAQTAVDKYRHEVDGVPIIATNGKKTWRYDPQTNTICIENQPYIASECWFGDQFLKQLKTFRKSVAFTHWQETYAKDPQTGKQRVLLKVAWLTKRLNGPRSMVIEFDAESTLLVGLKQWENSNWDGSPALIVEKVTYYDSLPDALFELEIPDGAKVVDEAKD
jgi:outer membrane lipoprotein-sorting protein